MICRICGTPIVTTPCPVCAGDERIEMDLKTILDIVNGMDDEVGEAVERVISYVRAMREHLGMERGH